MFCQAESAGGGRTISCSSPRYTKLRGSIPFLVSWEKQGELCRVANIPPVKKRGKSFPQRRRRVIRLQGLLRVEDL